MINAIINGIMSLIISLVNIIMLPIDTLISSALPDLSNGINWINTFLNTCLTYIGWCIDFLCIPTDLINLVVLYLTFKLTYPLVVYTIKLAIKWYNALKV